MKHLAITRAASARHGSLFESVQRRIAGVETTIISCYENEVPAFVESEIASLYGSIYASMPQFRIYGSSTETSTYLARKNGKIVTLFLFTRDTSTVRVLNEVINVDEVEIHRFSSYIFSTYPSISVILFKAVETNLMQLEFPFQRCNHLEDIVVSFQDSVEQFNAGFGKNTRRNIKRYMKKLLQDFPTFQFEIQTKSNIDAQSVREIVRFNSARMADKNKVSAFNEDEIFRLSMLANECGLLGVAKIDGRICAGAISYCVGKNYFLNVLAHDPTYDEYWLGILCCYLTMCECIQRGAEEFHFLWGRYEYKYTLQGVKRDLDNIAIYRSRMHLFLHFDRAINFSLHSSLRKLRLFLHDAKKGDTRLAHLATSAFNFIRTLKLNIHRKFVS